ncbi:hypothetical protein IFT67_19595 [Sphingomonas sp. CFBP 13728]|uniref:hypothetical protein n=1 Tax=Sphingomonas sp. CFBP 13728 TaxID=2775294 RepID=UPI0017803319|nr:hypothetical protein [Sphingomonas sp. CFBP 13728]MBD8621118.1 hypothetical protein [Sphingomonas sp. CFBP 13728]
MAQGGFGILDGMEQQYGIPIMRKFVSSGDFVVTPPTDRYVMVVPGNGAPISGYRHGRRIT